MTSDTVFVKWCEHLLPRFQVTIWKKKGQGGGALPGELDCKVKQGLGFECFILFFQLHDPFIVPHETACEEGHY